MSDFERAAALLKQGKHTGRKSSTSVQASDERVRDTSSSLESLQSLLRKKLNEPLDLLLQDDACPCAYPEIKAYRRDWRA